MWERDKNKGSVQFNQRIGLTTVDSNPGRGANASHYEFFELVKTKKDCSMFGDTTALFLLKECK